MATPSPREIEDLSKNHLISKDLVDVARLAVVLKRRGYPTPEIHKAILAMDKGGLWELHADTGIGGKFSREELEAVPPGPRGMHLTSARVIRPLPTTSPPPTTRIGLTGDQYVRLARLAGEEERRSGRPPRNWRVIQIEQGIPSGPHYRAAEAAYEEGLRSPSPAAEKAKKAQSAADKKSEAPFRKDYLSRIEKYRKILAKNNEKAAKEIPPAAELKKAHISELDDWAKELWELIKKKGLDNPEAGALRKQRHKLQYTRGMRDAKSSTENREPLPWQLKNAMEYGLPIPGDPAATEAAYRKGFADGVAKRPRSMAIKKKIARILAIEKRLQKKTGRKPEATRAELLKQSDEQIAHLLDMIEEIETLADQKAKREKKEQMAARSTKKPRTKKPAAAAAPSAAEKAAEKQAKAKAREADKASKAAEKAREKAAEKARKAAEKAAQKTATQGEKAKARESSRLARKEAKRKRELAGLKVNEAARSAVIASEIKKDRDDWEEWEKIPFTMEALLAANPEDARKLLGIAGRSQKAALMRQLRGEIKTLRNEIRTLKTARKQRAKVIRARCREAARDIRARMKKLREEFLRAWKELQAEQGTTRASCSADLSQVIAEIGPAITSVQGRQAKIKALMEEIRQAQAAGRKPLTPEQIKKRSTAADKLQQSDALVARDLAHHMGNVFPAAELWWEKKGKYLPSLKPGKIPEKASRSEAVMHYVENHIEDLQQFLEDDAMRELKAKEKAERDKQKVLAKMAQKQTRRRIQRGGRAGRMAGQSRARETIDARRRRFFEDAPF